MQNLKKHSAKPHSRRILNRSIWTTHFHIQIQPREPSKGKGLINNYKICLNSGVYLINIILTYFVAQNLPLPESTTKPLLWRILLI